MRPEITQNARSVSWVVFWPGPPLARTGCLQTPFSEPLFAEKECYAARPIKPWVGPAAPSETQAAIRSYPPAIPCAASGRLRWAATSNRQWRSTVAASAADGVNSW